MNNRKTVILLVSISLFFALIVIVWYFFIRSPGGGENITNATLPISDTKKGGSEFIDDSSKDDFEEPLTETEIIEGKKRKLIKIWNKPTAGMSFFEQNILINSTTSVKGTGTTTNEIIVQRRATSTRMIFADRATGYIYGVNLENKKSYQISNTTVPGIHDAYFFNNGSSVIFRYLDENNKIVSFKATIPSVIEGGTPRSLENVTPLPNDLISIAVSNSQKSASYVSPNTSGSSVYKIEGDKNQLIYNSPITEINLSYGGETLYSTNKTSSYSIGYINNVITNERIFGEKTGLVTLPANNNLDYLASMWSNVGLKTFIFSKKTGNYTTLNSQTIASKCIWNKTSTYIICGVPQELRTFRDGLPDAWYMGLINFNDKLYTIDNNTKIEEILFDFSEETKEVVDLTKPIMSPNDEYMSFINKDNGHLWLFNIKLTKEDQNQ